MGDTASRAKTRKALDEHGLEFHQTLPLLDFAEPRPVGDVLARLFCLNAVAAAAYGFRSASSLAWLTRENFVDRLSINERIFLEHGQGDPVVFRLQVEGMWALAWTLGIVSRLDFWRHCSSDFVTRLPDLKSGEGTARTIMQMNARDGDEVRAACDLYYCLNWVVRETSLRGQTLPPGLEPYVITERARALDWILGDDWGAGDLDT
ncbi:DUF4272 domain-containing protein [Devosia lacusdianchii]|uniref:DUF4272 domain-containing protein n=1 Tax=Devosia lacusdianchii TaxID=2917991 RepID=UPI003B8466A1